MDGEGLANRSPLIHSVGLDLDDGMEALNETKQEQDCQKNLHRAAGDWVHTLTGIPLCLNRLL